MKTKFLYLGCMILLSTNTCQILCMEASVAATAQVVQKKEPQSLEHSAFTAIARAIDTEIRQIKEYSAFKDWYAQLEKKYFARMTPDTVEAFKQFYLTFKVGKCVWKRSSTPEFKRCLFRKNGLLKILSDGTPIFTSIYEKTMLHTLPWSSLATTQQTFDTLDYQCMWEIKPGLLLYASSFCPNGLKRGICLLDMVQKKECGFQQFHENEVTSACMISETLVATGSMDSTIKVWNVTSGECVKSIPTNVGIRSLRVSGSHLIAVTSTGIQWWNLADFTLSSEMLDNPLFKSHNRYVFFADDTLAIFGFSSVITVFNIHTGTIKYSCQIEHDVMKRDFFTHVCPLDDRTFAAITDRAVLHIFNSETGECEQAICAWNGIKAPRNLICHKGVITYAYHDFSDEGHFEKHTFESLLKDAHFDRMDEFIF